MALTLGELVAYLRADDTALTKGVQRAKDKLKQLGDRAKQHGPVIGAALAAGIGAGLLGGLQLDAARAKLAAQVGDPAMAERLGQIAGQVYGRGFGESAAESMEAVRSVMQSGLLDPDADARTIEEITVRAQALATVWGEDVTQAARAAGQMIRTGLAADAAEALDIIAAGAQATGDLAGDLLDTVSEYSTQFRNMGLSGQQAMGLLAQGARAGARDLDVVADAIKEFSIEAVAGSDKIRDGFEELGLSADKMFAMIGEGGESAAKALDITLDRLREVEDPIERNAIAVELFGTKAEDLGEALYALDPSSAVEALGQVEGAAERMADTLEQSASQRLESFRRKAQQALVEKLGEAIPTIEKVVGWMDKHSGIIGPLVTGLGALAVIIGVILGVYKIWIILQTALNIVMMLNPIGLIILAVIGLIAIIVGLWLKFEGFREFWKKTWELIKDAALWVWDLIVTAAKKWWETFSGFWTGVGRFFKELWNGIVDGVKTAWTWITDKFNAVVNFIGGLPKRIGDKAKGMWDGIKNAFRSAINWIIQKWNSLSFSIPGISIPGIGQVWGGATLSTPDIPMLARGGHILSAGLALVGEAGPELLHLPRGATVQPLTGGAGGAAPAGAAGHTEIRVTGELVARGSDLVAVIREDVRGPGRGDVVAHLSPPRGRR